MNESNGLSAIRFALLTRAAEGLTQWRPMLLSFATLLTCAILLIAGQMIGLRMFSALGVGIFLLFACAAAIVLMVGISAVGAMLMDKAQELPVRSFSEAVSFGILSIPKMLGLALLACVVALAFFAVAGIVYMVCKIPFLGAVLAFVAHPILVVVGAFLFVACMMVVFPLFAPAVWSGLPFKAALASVIAIARSRLVPVVLMLIVLYAIVGVIGGLLISGLLPSGMALTSMAAGILGGVQNGLGGYGYGAGMGPLAMLMSGISSSGGFMGILMGMGVLGLVVAALMSQVTMLGLNLVYLEAHKSVDMPADGAALDDMLGGMREQMHSAKDRAMQATERARQMAAQKAEELAAAQAKRREEAAQRKAEQDALAEAQAEKSRLAAIAAQAELDRAAQEEAERQQLMAQETARQQALEEEQARLREDAERARLQAAEAQAQADREAEVLRQKALAEEAERQKAKEAALAAEAKAEAERQRAQAAAATQAAQSSAAVLSCPACQASVEPNDKFCGECGKTLK